MKSAGARCHAVVPAAGIGSRMDAPRPKQYLQIRGKTLLEYSLETLLACDQIASVVVALHPADTYATALTILGHEKITTVSGAQQRGGSVLAGLEALAAQHPGDDWVLVHDAARPCVRQRDIERLISAVIATGVGGLLAEQVVDTVKQAGADARVSATLDRDGLWRAQTPQMFRLQELRGALQAALAAGATVTDEASAMELAGFPVQLVAGFRGNLKVTVPEDLPLAAWYLEQGSGQ